jgi:DNA-directed RNA polymerase specialized sigma24 family protein
MSPSSLRRYRAERLLREEFGSLRGRVLVVVRGRLRARGVTLDAADLEACYAHAWQGLYAAMLAGQEIANPAGWLMLVTFRRAIEEHRARRRLGSESISAADAEGEPVAALVAAGGPDLAAQLDDRLQLRRLFEGLRGRLSAREREAAVLCYLQGLTRAEAAARMGLSEARMRKLMEGPGGGRPGVAGKVAALAAAIREGDWCEQQGSLMRGLAFGVLDPAGERYRLALIHRDQCPACRAYVLNLRGLAAALPPVLLPLGLGAGVLGLGGGVAPAGSGSVGSGVTAGTGTGAGGTAAASAGGAAAGGAGGAAAGGAAAGGGWVALGGPLGAKLAVGCLLAVGVGAGCVALGVGHAPRRVAAGGPPVATHALRHRALAPPPVPVVSSAQLHRAPVQRTASSSRSRIVKGGGEAGAPAAAAREFTPEQPAAGSAAAGRQPAAEGRMPAVAAALPAPAPSGASGGQASAPAEAKAQREFSPG